jgi:hypothetical protein
MMVLLLLLQLLLRGRRQRLLRGCLRAIAAAGRCQGARCLHHAHSWSDESASNKG